MGEGIGPAVHSAILAAEAIVSNSEYDLTSLARFSVPGFFRNRSKQARLSAIGDRQPLSLP
jgi:flavin-dependent dehydrogenase